MKYFCSLLSLSVITATVLLANPAAPPSSLQAEAKQLPIEIEFVKKQHHGFWSDDIYQMGKELVTTSQYAAFLNAVAWSGDSHDLYHGRSSITCTEMEGDFVFTPIPGSEEAPMTNITLQDACRFCNWLQHDQPTKEDGEEVCTSSTETGAYTFFFYEGEEEMVQSQQAYYFVPYGSLEFLQNSQNNEQGFRIAFTPTPEKMTLYTLPLPALSAYRQSARHAMIFGPSSSKKSKPILSKTTQEVLGKINKGGCEFFTAAYEVLFSIYALCAMPVFLLFSSSIMIPFLMIVMISGGKWDEL